jgi:N-acetylmuramoyl-L-alanine amidase
MRSMLRALVVIVLVTGAGTALPSVADSIGAPTAVEKVHREPNREQATPTSAPTTPAAQPTTTPQAARKKKKRRPLRAITIAIDPGHQLGNHNFPRETNAPVPAGGFTKPCNTTGTATNSGVAEATVNFRLSQLVSKRLRKLGARVRMTRTTDSERLWGPCVDTRGEFGKRVGARLMVSLHADGASASSYGFHVIAPTSRSPWTTDIASASLRLATALRNSLTAGGVPRSTYVGGGSGLNVRNDLGTLNMSDVPVAMIEIGNMRNASDALRMTSRRGQARYAKAVVKGIRAYLGR